MQKRPLKNIALLGFLIGILFIVFILFITSRNINQLINSNQALLNELRTRNDLRKMEADLLSVESDIRGAVISANPEFLSDVEEKIQHIDNALVRVNKELRSSITSGEVERLMSLVNRKVEFSREILDAFEKKGKPAAEAIINSGTGKLMRDSIVQIITVLDQSRQQKSLQITNTIKKSGSEAKISGAIMAILASILLVFAFWYILNLSTGQQRMISDLNISEKRLKEASSMKEQFMANMSHEIRTPMNAIIGFTNILKRTDLDPEQRQYVQNIHSSGENLLALINDILDLSKIEAGMLQFEETNFSLRSITSSVGAMFTEKIKEKQLSYRGEIAADVPDILSGDAIRLTQILVNLLGNATKFTEAGEISLSLKLVHASKKEATIEIKVADTGIGIAKEKQAKIFERFQQAETETTRRFGGTGLGLSIVKQLVELQKGTIDIKSETGRGSEFTVRLPYKLPDEEKLLSAALATETQVASISDIHVLIAEDNAMNQQLIKHLMKNWNIRFTLVNNGAEAVEALNEQEFSVVLMDIQMPEMDGYTATEVIRKELGSDIPIIAMTAHAMIGEKERCIQLGMNDYISKPLKETVLYNIIAQYSYYGANKT